VQEKRNELDSRLHIQTRYYREWFMGLDSISCTFAYYSFAKVNCETCGI
jgi:hypothetical protein